MARREAHRTTAYIYTRGFEHHRNAAIEQNRGALIVRAEFIIGDRTGQEAILVDMSF